MILKNNWLEKPGMEIVPWNSLSFRCLWNISDKGTTFCSKDLLKLSAANKIKQENYSNATSLRHSWILLSNLYAIYYIPSPGLARIRTRSISGFWAATTSARDAPINSPTRYIGFLAARLCSDLMTRWTSITRSRKKQFNILVIRIYVENQHAKYLYGKRNREIPANGVRSAAGMCKHHTLKILHIMIIF